MTMDTYSHVLPSMQKDAMEKMNDVFKKPSSDITVNITVKCGVLSLV